jgi:hypothetical protein
VCEPTPDSNLHASSIKLAFQTGFRYHHKEMTMNSKQVVLITSSSTGFGRLFADTLARKGHTVFATMRDPESRKHMQDGSVTVERRK